MFSMSLMFGVGHIEKIGEGFVACCRLDLKNTTHNSCVGSPQCHSCCELVTLKNGGVECVAFVGGILLRPLSPRPPFTWITLDLNHAHLEQEPIEAAWPERQLVRIGTHHREFCASNHFDRRAAFV